MSKVNWLDILGWNIDELEDIRFVAYTYIKEGQYEIALNFFEALIVLDPDNLYDLQILGALYLQNGKSLDALHYLDKSLKIEPNHTQTLLNRTKALFMLGYKKQAIAQARKLETSEDKSISKQASALLLSYV